MKLFNLHFISVKAIGIQQFIMKKEAYGASLYSYQIWLLWADILGYLTHFFAFKLTKDGNIQRSEKDVNVGKGMRYQKMVAAALIGYF